MGTGVSFTVWSPEEVRRTVRHDVLEIGLMQEWGEFALAFFFLSP
jgi:hypothetical protein